MGPRLRSVENMLEMRAVLLLTAILATTHTANGLALPPQSPIGPNEVFSPCESHQKTCETLFNPPTMVDASCNAGYVCIKGMVRIFENGPCIPQEQCYTLFNNYPGFGRPGMLPTEGVDPGFVLAPTIRT